MTSSRILIVLLGAIGDVVRALPLATRIREAWPESELHWAIEPKSKDILTNHPAIDKIIVFQREKGFFAYLKFIRELRYNQYDLVFDLQRHLKSGVTSFSTGAKRRVGFHRKNAKECNWLFNNQYISEVQNFTPKIQHYQLFGDAVALPPKEPFEFGLTPNTEELSSIKEFFQPQSEKRVAIILGSSWESRLWPITHYCTLLSRLQSEFNYTPFLIGGPSEETYAEQILSSVGEKGIINLVGKTSLRELVPLFSQMHIAIGPDSGPMHIAAGVGIPVVSFWGSTSPRRSAPYGSEHLVIESPIGCAPCYKRKCPGLGNLCLLEILPEAVLAQMQRALDAD